MDYVIVSRHPAAIEWIRQKRPDLVAAPVFANVSISDVAGKIVVGNVPLHLAAVADRVLALEFSGVPPRGQEYSVADMDAAGARLVPYRVEQLG